MTDKCQINNHRMAIQLIATALNTPKHCNIELKLMLIAKSGVVACGTTLGVSALIIYVKK